MVMPPTVLVTAPRAVQAIERYRLELGAAGCAVTAWPTVERLDEHELLPLVGDITAIVCGDDRITSRVLDAAPQLRVIAKWGTGIDSIDVASARGRGILVCNTPAAFSEPVADTVLGYVLLFARQLDRMTEDMRAGAWQRRPLRALNECTLGIVGFGATGRAVARRATSFGMRLLANCLQQPTNDELRQLGVTMVPLETLLAESDFVTLHADLRPTNRHLIDDARLRCMKPGGILINTARGPLVDERALTAALQEGRLAGAALDVFEEEPLPPGSALRRLPNVHLAPHNANGSQAAADRVHANTIRNVLQALETDRL
jgi:D-3-phosphoglycerate dehydrogenase